MVLGGQHKPQTGKIKLATTRISSCRFTKKEGGAEVPDGVSWDESNLFPSNPQEVGSMTATLSIN
jgi:hypothetical protein